MAAALSKIFIGIMIAAALFLTFSGIYTATFGHYQDYYGFTPDDNMGDVYRQLNETFDLTEDMSNKVRDQSSTQDTAQDSAVLSSTSALRLAWNSFPLANAMMQAITIELDAPWYIQLCIMGVFLFSILAAIIAATFRITEI